LMDATYIRAQKKTEMSRSRRTQRIVSSVVVMLCFMFLIVGSVNVISATSNAYVVVVDGNELCTLVSRSEAESAIAQALSIQSESFSDEFAYDVDYTNDVSIEAVSAIGAVYSSVNEAAGVINQQLDFVANATALLIDDQVAFYVADDNAALQVVKAAKDYYSADSENFDRVYTSESISLSTAEVDMEEVLSYDEALNMLIYGQLTATDDPNPLITVHVAKYVVATEALPYSTERIDNSSLPLGKEEVETEGVDGVQEVTYYVVTVNDQIVSSEQISAEVITPAVNEVIQVGTALWVSSRLEYCEREYVLPVTKDSGYVITSYFGIRSRGWHSGVDFGIRTGTPIYASKSGTIIYADWNSGGYGYLVSINHGDGTETRYAHLSEILVSNGDYVEQGTLVALSGNTGNSTGPHLHFEIRIDGTAYDPLAYLDSY